MTTIWNYLVDRPWLWVLLAVATAIWIAGIWTLVRSDKFLRKWLWAILVLVSFQWSWSISDTMTIGVGLPLGSIYILWFARFGRAPTLGERAAHESRLTAAAQARPTGGRRRILQLTYGFATAAVLATGLWFAFGPPALTFGDLGQFAEMRMMVPAMGVFAVLYSLLFMYLAVRPQWWGKLISGLTALAWLGNGLGRMAMSQIPDAKGFNMGSPVAPILGGSVMLVVTLIHLVIDRLARRPFPA